MIDVSRLSAITIDEDVMKTSDDEVDRTTCPDRDLVRDEQVLVAGSAVNIWEAIEWWGRLPLAKADRGCGEGASNGVVLVLFRVLRQGRARHAGDGQGRRADACFPEKLSSLHIIERKLLF